MNAVLIVALFAVAQPPIAPKPPQAPPIAVEPKVAKSYADYRAEAIAAGKPIVIFVRCQDRPIAGAVVVRVDHLAGYDSGPNVVIGVPDSSLGMRWKATLDRDASDAAIRREWQVSRQAIPFFNSLRGRRTADDSKNRQLSVWEELGAVRYDSAKWTQVAYKTVTGEVNANNVHAFGDTGRIDRWPVALLDTKWHSPGGLELVDGWTSERYKFLPSPAIEQVELVTMPNGQLAGDYSSGKQKERLIVRKYVDGSWFVERLRNAEGIVFEDRVSEKENGEWKHYVAFSNPSARPPRYSPVASNKCVGCHEQAGRGVYAGARNPGGDRVFSDPFAALEK